MNNNFEHLQIPYVLEAKPHFESIRVKKNTVTARNRENRIQHGFNIKRQSQELSSFWKNARASREADGLPQIPAGIPIMLEIEPDTDIEFLRGLGFEIISEVDNGFVLVSSEDIDLDKFNLQIQKFIDKVNLKCDSPAKVYGLKSNDERIATILAGSIKEQWHNLKDNDNYLVEISVSCNAGIKLPEKPKKKDAYSDDKYNEKLLNWEENYNTAYEKWDIYAAQRQTNLENFISDCNGEIISPYIDNGQNTENYVNFPDSFSVNVSINGKGLKDLIANYPYVFEISMLEDIAVENEIGESIEKELAGINILSPRVNAPIIGLIDSGVQNNNKLLSPALMESYSYVKGDVDTNDKVEKGGHGTRVAGIMLYDGIKLEGNINLPFWVRNIRVLDEKNYLRKELSGANLLERIVKKYNIDADRKTRIFNHSIGSSSPFKLTHMSSWAAIIDKLNYENDVLFIQSAGNIEHKRILKYIEEDNNYPEYLEDNASRICNPAQSLQALTVGAISPSDFVGDNMEILGGKDKPSSFSRSGPGIWDSVKPDVVEYGGTHVLKRENGYITLCTPEPVCINAPIKGNSKLFSQDAIGTSFSTPKVTSLAAELEDHFPTASTLLYRGLIAQSAHWPLWAYNFGNVSTVLRRIGYGIPSRQRALSNNEYRVTLFADKMSIYANNAHVYKVPIPDVIRNVGEDYDILIEITLSYNASSRRTRRRIKGYLSTWLDWCTSRLGEDYDTFKNRVFETGKKDDELDEGNFSWMVGGRKNYGQANNFSTKFSTLQKDWTFVKSNRLPEDFCVAVRGHKGWSDALPANYSLIVSFEAVNRDLELYNEIRAAIEIEIENSRARVEINT